MANIQSETPQAIDVVMSGGHGEYFFESFDESAASQGAAISLAPDDAAQRSNAAIVTGDAAVALVANRGQGVAIDLLPDAAHWHLIATLPALSASPVYGRAPDAKLPKGKAA